MMDERSSAVSSGGQVAIVTGASRGIGRAVAERLAAAGARLVLVGRRDRAALSAVEASCRATGADAVTHLGDVGAPGVAEAVRDVALQRHGRIDLLVNNAGVAVEGLLAELDDAELAAMLATNVEGVVRMARAVLRSMLRQRSGCIINVSSVVAARPGRGNAVYAGTKGFVESFTRALAVEVGRKQIRVNAVAPGVTETGMSQAVRGLAGDALRERVGLGRWGQPDDVASAVAFLASDAASYISGAVLAVDGAYLGP
jgi:3-oxoacyl-[acyl-carrier protein] reductase